MMDEQIIDLMDFLKKIDEFDLPTYKELPSVPLYMEQVITYVNNVLKPLSDKEKNVLTSFMVNNYVKQKVIPAPVNKKYSKMHLIYLISLGILKNVLSITDIRNIIKMQITQYPIEIAYDFFAQELENALLVTFGDRDFSQSNSASKRTQLSEVIHSAALSFTNRIYVKKNIKTEFNN